VQPVTLVVTANVIGVLLLHVSQSEVEGHVVGSAHPQGVTVIVTPPSTSTDSLAQSLSALPHAWL
jgi:hypothetical protein